MNEKMSRTKSTVINTLASVFNRFFYIVLNFALRTIFIYTLGIQYTGVSSVFTDILTMLSLSELGIGTAIATALYVPLKENDEVQIRKLMHFYRNAYRWIAGFILVIGVVLLPFLDRIITNVPDIKENIYIIFIFYIIKTSSSYLLIYKTTLLNADQKQYLVKGTESVCMIVRYIVEIIFLIAFRQYMIYLIIEVAATIFQNMIITRRAVKLYPYAFEKTKERLESSQVRQLFKNIKGLAMYQLSASVGNSVDNILISSFISTAAVGMLSNYTLIRKQIEGILKQFFTSVTPSIGSLVAEKNGENQYIIFKKLFYLSFIMVNFCATSLIVLFQPFITLWLGTDFLLGTEIVFIIGIDFFLYILLQAVASFRTANGLFVKGQYRPFITAVLNIIFSILLIHKYGILGTIFATVICRIVTQWYDPYLLYKYVFHKKFGPFYRTYWGYVAIFLSGSALTYLVSIHIFVLSQSFDFILRILCCVILPNIWAFLWTMFTPECKYVIRMLKNRTAIIGARRK